MIKSGNNPLMPGIGKLNFDSPAQGSKPVPLTTSVNATDPFIPRCLGHDTRTDNGNGSLKTLKIAPRTNPNDTPAIRTPVSPQPQGFIVSIKTGQYKTVSPYSITAAFRASVRLKPGIFLSEDKKVLEYNGKKDYHCFGP
jgi:hypothetical protein